MLIIARTDARAGELIDHEGSGGGGGVVNGEDEGEAKFREAVERLRGSREAGADALFLEAPRDSAECRRACEALAPTPVLLNVVPGGVTPNMSVEEARGCGFRIVIFPTACIEGVMRGCGEELGGLRKEGAMTGEILGIRRAFELCGMGEAVEVDEAAGGGAYGQI